MTRQESAEFRKMETEFKRDWPHSNGTPNPADVMRWLADARQAGKRFGWVLCKSARPGTPPAPKLPTQPGGPV